MDKIHLRTEAALPPFKRRYTRKELTYDAGGRKDICILCKHLQGSHSSNCPFVDKTVTSVILVKSRPSVVLGYHDNRWWWRSPGSGNEYHIEKLPACVGWPNGRYQMSDSPGNTVATRRRLGEIRDYIFLNQGEL